MNPDWDHDRTGFSSMFVNLLAMIYAPLKESSCVERLAAR